MLIMAAGIVVFLVVVILLVRRLMTQSRQNLHLLQMLEDKQQQSVFFEEQVVRKSLSPMLLILSDSLHNFQGNSFIVDLTCLMRSMSGGYGAAAITYIVESNTYPSMTMRAFIQFHNLDGFSYSDLFMIALMVLLSESPSHAISMLREVKSDEKKYRRMTLDICNKGSKFFDQIEMTFLDRNNRTNHVN